MSLSKLTGMLLYVQAQRPVDCFDKSKGKEYKVSVVVDEDTADAFSEAYPKQAAKKVKRVDFEKLYKVAPPEGTEKNLFILTLKKGAHYKDKNDSTGKTLLEIADIYKPKVLLQTEGGRTDITNEIAVANGSYGSVSFEENVNPQYGTSAKLKNILVTELIEYEGGERGEIGSEFDDDAPTPAPKKEPVKASPKVVKEQPKAKTEEDQPF